VIGQYYNFQGILHTANMMNTMTNMFMVFYLLFYSYIKLLICLVNHLSRGKHTSPVITCILCLTFVYLSMCYKHYGYYTDMIGKKTNKLNGHVGILSLHVHHVVIHFESELSSYSRLI
jgi:uncharacterized membrane protein